MVCGGRDFNDPGLLYDVLSSFNIETIIHGGARGADWMAGFYGALCKIPVVVYEAEWDKYGISAGPKRNQRMLNEASPDIVIAFPGGNGTKDMVRRARRAKLPIVDAMEYCSESDYF